MFDPRNLRIMLIKEFRQIRRDRQTLRMIFAMPLMMMIMFGFAVSREIRHLDLAIIDRDRTPQSREFIRAMTGPGSFDAEMTPDTMEQARVALDKGHAHAAILIEPGFARDIVKKGGGRVSMLIDGTDPQIAVTALGYARQISYNRSIEIVAEKLRRNPPPVPIPEIRSGAVASFWYNPDLRKVNYYVPSLIGMILTQVTLILTALAIVREKELGSMELLLSSPLSPADVILGKTIPYIIIGFFDLAMILLSAVFIFGVNINGSLFHLLALSLLYIFSSLSVGLTFSSIANNQQQAIYLINFYMITNLLLSGFIFPVGSMPKFMQYVTYIVPLRYYLNIIRGIVVKGVGPAMLWPEIAGLAAIGFVAVLISLKTFRTTLD